MLRPLHRLLLLTIFSTIICPLESTTCARLKISELLLKRRGPKSDEPPEEEEKKEQFVQVYRQRSALRQVLDEYVPFWWAMVASSQCGYYLGVFLEQLDFNFFRRLFLLVE
uniref:Battenin n=1 Tax=Caenorhabditis japonica TaxID=281687 RepID=A0A8R1EVR2_CAEJA